MGLKEDGRENVRAYNKLLTIRISTEIQERLNREVEKRKIGIPLIVREAIESHLDSKKKVKKVLKKN
jgi:predicted DNA-binding protein